MIEITIALMVLAVGLVGILTLFPVGFDAAGRANKITIATFLAQEKMEDAKRTGYGNVSSVGTETAFDSPYANFQYTISVSYVQAGLEQVDVIIYWPTGDPSQRTTGLTTYLADYGS